MGTTETLFRIGKSKSTLDAGSITAARTHTLPDNSGTLALLSDISSGSSSTKVTKTGIALGTMAANQTAFTYTTVTATAARGLMSQLIVESSLVGIYDVVVRGAGNDSGTLWLNAVSVAQKVYALSLPVYVENDTAGQDFFIGIRNRGNLPATFTLNNLRMEKFA